MMTSKRSRSKLVLLLVLALCVTSATAETLYKLVDRNGKVTYTGLVPKDYDGQVIRLQIDASTNTMPPPPAAKVDGAVRAETESEKIIRRRPPNNDEQVQAARLKVEAAQAAFVAARDNSVAEDWTYVGPANPLGMRRFPKPEYEARLAGLQQDVKVAQEDLDKLQRSF